MNPSQLQSQAQTAAQQGQSQLASYNNSANSANSQYQQQQAAATAANNNLNSYTNYMQGAGSGTNLYNTGLSQAESSEGFDPNVLGRATQNLTGAQNALYGLNQAAQSSTGGYGLSGSQLGSYYASQSQPLTNQVQTQSTAVGNLTNLLTAAQNQANQYSGAGLTNEGQTSTALSQVFTNAQAQAAQSLQNAQFYSNLAQQQGGLNATEQQAYDSAIASYQAAQASAAQAGLYASQTTGQNLTNQQTQAAIAAAAQKAQTAATTPTVNKADPFASGINSETSPQISAINKPKAPLTVSAF